ncbi:MAG TPA: hypothetical protein VFE51_10760 [Verrucomicrobiae bacterium]|nr:hypothetical protein [Verrucomicrobiae bacterium]
MRDWFVRLAFLGTLCAALFCSWHWLFPSPQQVIRKRLSQLAAAASIAPNEAPLVKLAKAQRLSTFFAMDARVNVDIPGRAVQGFNGRDEIQQAAIGARAILNTLKVEFVDVVVEVGPDKKSARAHLTATANLPGEKIPEVQELEIGFTNIDREWLINQAQTIKTLR